MTFYCHSRSPAPSSLRPLCWPANLPLYSIFLILAHPATVPNLVLSSFRLPLCPQSKGLKTPYATQRGKKCSFLSFKAWKLNRPLIAKTVSSVWEHVMLNPPFLSEERVSSTLYKTSPKCYSHLHRFHKPFPNKGAALIRRLSHKSAHHISWWQAIH